MSECPVCGGEGQFMGALGVLAHFCCRNCGMWYNQEIDTTIFLDDEDFEDQYYEGEYDEDQ